LANPASSRRSRNRLLTQREITKKFEDYWNRHGQPAREAGAEPEPRGDSHEAEREAATPDPGGGDPDTGRRALLRRMT